MSLPRIAHGLQGQPIAIARRCGVCQVAQRRHSLANSQVCDGRGGFAKNGNERDFSPVQSN